MFERVTSSTVGLESSMKFSIDQITRPLYTLRVVEFFHFKTCPPGYKPLSRVTFDIFIYASFWQRALSGNYKYPSPLPYSPHNRFAYHLWLLENL